MIEEKASKKAIFLLLFLVLGVRIAYLAVFHDRVFLGPSTQYDQAFVAIHLLKGEGVRTYKEPPRVVESADPSRLIDPERYAPPSEETFPYIKEVTGYAGFLALVWKITGTKLWIHPQAMQVLFETLVALGLYLLALKSFGRRAAFWTALGFAFLVFEARSSVVPYKDIFLLYVMLGIAFLSRLLFLRRGRPLFVFAAVAVLAAAGFHFMPSVALYPFFLAFVLALARRVDLKTGAACLLVAAAILVRRKRGAEALLFLHIPLYFLLLHMFFHYEARYLLGTLPGSLPLIGFLFGDVLPILRFRERST